MKLKSKWKKYLRMRTSLILAEHLPPTRLLNREVFHEKLLRYLERYNDIILKPLRGNRGFGVIRVTSIDNGKTIVHTEDRKHTFVDLQSMAEYVYKLTDERQYILQKRVQLATIGQRPFDIRVIVQRQRNANDWIVTGKVAKVAGYGYIVTNIKRSHGDVMHVQEALQNSTLPAEQCEWILEEIDQLALETASRLTKYYPTQHIYGLDVGIDEEGHIWIIEANTRPMLSHFEKLQDKRMYLRILRYKKR